MRDNIKHMKEIIDQFKSIWFILIFVGGVIVSWTTFSNKLENYEVRLMNVEKKQAAIDPKITQIQVDIASIKTTLEILSKN